MFSATGESLREKNVGEVVADILKTYRVAGASFAVLSPTGDGDAVVRAQVRPTTWSSTKRIRSIETVDLCNDRSSAPLL